MDLQLILRVIWRYKLIVGIGVVLAFALAFLSYYKVSPSGDPKLAPRQAETWESLSTIFVTSRGFPWGSTGAPNAPAAADSADATGTAEQPPAEVGPDPVHLTALAALYIRLATSDPVIKEMEKSGPVDGELQAFPVASDDSGRGTELPMLTLSAQATGPEEAKALADRHRKAFIRYIERQQAGAGIPSDERVVLQTVREPTEPELLVGRKKTRPMIVLVAVLIVTLGLAFTLENLRPRVRVLPGQESYDGPSALPLEANRRAG